MPGPVLTRMLDVCLRGAAGSRLQQVLDSEEYSSAIQWRRSLLARFDEETAPGIALRTHPWLVSAMLMTFPERKAISKLRDAYACNGETLGEEYDELAVLFELLGKKSVETAARVLPAELREMARDFPKVSASEQIMMLETVYAILKSRHHSTPWHVDIFDQPLSRIFPRRFGRWNKESNPNCLGKGQLLVGFARAANANVFGVTPIVTAYDATSQVCQEWWAKIMRIAVQEGIPVTFRSIQSFERSRLTTEHNRRRPTSFHMAAAIQLKDRRWYLLDPHQCKRGLLGETEWRMTKVESYLERHGRIHPGIAVPTGGAPYSKMLASVSMKKASLLMGRTQMLWTLTGKKRVSPQSSLLLTARSGLLTAMINYGAAISDSALVLFRAVFGQAGEAPRLLELLYDRIPEEIEKDRMDIESVLVLLDIASDHTLIPALASRRYSGEERWDLLRRPFLTFFSMCIAGAAYTAFQDSEKVFHPGVEMYRPELRIGVELVSHLNSISLRDESVVSALGSVCSGELHLRASASELFRTGANEVSAQSKFALDVLLASPFRSKGTKRLLERLVEEGKLEVDNERSRTDQAMAR